MNSDQAAVSEQVRGAWRSAMAAVDGEAIDVEGMLVLRSDVDFPPYNSVLVTQAPDDPEAALARAASLLRERGWPLRLQARSALAPLLDPIASTLGLEARFEMPAMILSPLAPLDCASPAEIRAVEDERDYELTLDASTAAFDMPRELVRRIRPIRLLERPGIAMYVALADGAPVASACSWADDDAVQLFGVGTVPSARRRGIGAAITANAIALAAKEGATWAWLHASEMGFPVYERMGFRVVERWRFYGAPEEVR